MSRRNVPKIFRLDIIRPKNLKIEGYQTGIYNSDYSPGDTLPKICSLHIVVKSQGVSQLGPFLRTAYSKFDKL